MFKKFNNNLSKNPISIIWGISFSMLLGCLFNSAIPQEGIVSKAELALMLFGFATVFNFVISTWLIYKGEIKQINVTYVCPTARQYMSEHEIKKYEKSVEEEIKKDIEFGEELEKAYKQI